MLKTILIVSLPVLVFLGNFAQMTVTGLSGVKNDPNNGIMKKMIVERAELAIELNSEHLYGSGIGNTEFRLDAEPESFFTFIVYNDELRGPLPSSMNAVSKESLPGMLGANGGTVTVENLASGNDYEMAIRDAKSGMVFYYVQGHVYEFLSNENRLDISLGKLILSKEYAIALGRESEALAPVGTISINAKMRPIEILEVKGGEVVSQSMPPQVAGTIPGPDVVVGDLNGLAQFGSSSGTQVGLAVGTDSCNYGVVNLNWFQNPSNDHPVIPQNMYRMSGGANNDERFEQIGQSSVKHAFTALTQNLCSLGCNGVGGSQLGSGCSDPYSASLNAGPNLGSRAFINPYTGFYPRNDSATPNNTHTGHTHVGPSHRILTEIADLNTSLNPGATYYAEAQYITPHEYAWCQSNPGQCNMNNNVSYRRYNVTGTGSPFSFSPAAATVRTQPAINAWTGSTQSEIKPDSVNDGIGILAYKVTNPSPGVWHYEYAIYNQNLDRAIQSFSIPLGAGVTLTNVGFKAPPQHPGWANDGTVGGAGFSNAAWSSTQAGGLLTWATETFAQNPNANAIRWGTMYNFRFDSNRPPQAMNATIGFYKTGSPFVVSVQGPSPAAAVNVSVSGRVTTSGGRAVYMARVTMNDGQGNIRTAITNPFGYYRFTNVLSGTTYNMGVGSKEYTFASRDVTVNDNVTDVNFVAQ